MFELKPGDVLLFNKGPELAYKIISNYVGETVTDIIARAIDYEYYHAALFLHAGREGRDLWTLEATEKGVYLINRPLDVLTQIDVYRYKFESNAKGGQAIVEKALKYWNMPYDLTSLILNGITEVTNVLGFEHTFEKQLRYNSSSQLICSELIARAYADAGYRLSDIEEFTSPTDIANSKYMIKLT